MLMTEDEAKERWCPFVRYLAVFRNDAGNRETAGCFNRGGADSGLEKSRCIASECMAWRWDEDSKKAPYTAGGHPQLPEDEWKGRCGLAGKP